MATQELGEFLFQKQRFIPLRQPLALAVTKQIPCQKKVIRKMREKINYLILLNL